MVMPRKKRIILVISIITVLVLIALVLTGGFLYIKTDMFKSNEELFAKYLSQNINIFDCLTNEYAETIKDSLENEKYVSNIEGKVEFEKNEEDNQSENENTEQRTDNAVNDIKLSINSDVDGSNNTYHRNIKIMQDDKSIVGIQTLKSSNSYGVKFKGVKQYIADNSNSEKLADILGLNDYQTVIALGEIDLDKINIAEIVKLTEEEKTTLSNKYLTLVNSKLSKNNYKKQSNALITLNEQSFNTTAYSIEMPREKYIEIMTDVINQTINDEIITNKINLVEEKIKSVYTDFKPEKSLRKQINEILDNKLEEIKNDVGSDTIKITVYQNNMQTVRTTLEIGEKKYTLDIYDNTGFRYENIKLGTSEDSNAIEFKRTGTNESEEIIIQSEKVEANSMTNITQIGINKKKENEDIKKEIKIEMKNEKYNSNIQFKNDIKIVDSFNEDEKIETIDDMENNLKENSKIVYLNDFSNEQIENFSNAIKNKSKENLDNLKSKISLKDYIDMLQKLNIIKKEEEIDLGQAGKVSETEKVRFNSTFEYYQTDGLTNENLENFISVMSKNISSVRIIDKNNKSQKLTKSLIEDEDKLRNIKDNFKEVLIGIQKNESNKDYDNLLKKLFEELNSTYSGKLDYNEKSGLVERIHIIGEKEQ